MTEGPFTFDYVSRTVVVPAGRADEGDTVRVQRADGSIVEVELGPFVGYADEPNRGFNNTELHRFAVERPMNVRMFKAPTEVGEGTQ